MKRRVRLVEIWKPVVGYEDWYAVSNHGRIKRLGGGFGAVKGRILSLRPGKKGYCYVNFFMNGYRRTFAIHRLVLEAFVGPCPPGHECNHDDGDKGNNCLWNLEWVTKRKNHLHRCYVLGKLPSWCT